MNNQVGKFVECYKNNRKHNLKNADVVAEVLASYNPTPDTTTKFIKEAFLKMLGLYDEREKKFTIETLAPVYKESLDRSVEPERLIASVYDHDYKIYDSNAQARRNARGYFLESVLNHLFELFAKDKYLSQVKLEFEGKQKRIDFVVGPELTADVASRFEEDKFLYITAKKSIRERGSQVSEEKKFLGDQLVFFFYADIKKLSDGDVKKFYNEDIVVVTYRDSIPKYYSNCSHVISFEKFFSDVLPAFLRDRNNFKVYDAGVETLTFNKNRDRFTNGCGYRIRKAEAG